MFGVTKELLLDTKLEDLKWFCARYDSDAKLNGKTILITGSNTGIGKELTKNFYRRGAKILMACRNLEKAEDAKNDIVQECATCENKGELIIKQLDLENMKNVRRSAQEILKTEPKIDMLVNNAGSIFTEIKHTADGFEQHFGVNYLGSFLFTLLLIPNILTAGSAKIINISSMSHRYIDFEDLDFAKRGHYSTLAKIFKCYGQSKLANILFAKELARRFKEINADVKTYSLHPGTIYTQLIEKRTSLVWTILNDIRELIFSFLLKTVEQGIQTTLYCALSEDADKETGLYYDECEVRKPSNAAEDEKLAKKLWNASWDFVKLEKDYDPFNY